MTNTSPRRWTEALAAHQPPPLDLTGYRKVVVLAAHPDDETLGVGGTLRALHRAGAETTLVVATDGEAAYPGLDQQRRSELARTRRAELRDALHAAGLEELAVHWLGLPDGRLAEHLGELTERLIGPLAGADAYLAPWTGDPHPDHRAVGDAAAAAAAATTYGWGYPIWMWAWMRPERAEIPWRLARSLPLGAGDLAAKHAACARYASQLDAPPPGCEPVLPAELLAAAYRSTELVFREPRRTGAPLDRFARLYADGVDPWAEDSWYERRKRAVLCASLPRERYRHGFEPGCGTGALTVALAGRCARLDATEPVAGAARRARQRLEGRRGVRVGEVPLPRGIPTTPIDLAVFSEVLYYLDDATLAATLDATLAAVEPGGDLVLAHWRGWPAEAPRDEADTAALVRARPELVERAQHRDERFVIHVLSRR